MKAYSIRTNGEIYEPELTEERMKSMGHNHRKKKERECNCTRPYEIELTEQEYIQTCNTEQLAEALLEWWIDGADTYTQFGLFQHEIDEAKEKIVEWLKQPHKE